MGKSIPSNLIDNNLKYINILGIESLHNVIDFLNKLKCINEKDIEYYGMIKCKDNILDYVVIKLICLSPKIAF